MKDSGIRHTYETQAQREPAIDRGRFDLISPIATQRLALWYEQGAKKYSPRNWEKGIPLTRTIDSLLRHLNLFQLHDNSEDHLAAICWNAFALLHTHEMIERCVLPKSLDDRPKYTDLSKTVWIKENLDGELTYNEIVAKGYEPVRCPDCDQYKVVKNGDSYKCISCGSVLTNKLCEHKVTAPDVTKKQWCVACGKEIP